MHRFKVIMFLFFLYQCSCIGIRKNDVRKINVVYRIPSLVTKDSIILAIDSGFIYYFKKYRIYENPVFADSLLSFENSSTYHGTKFNYIGYDITKKMGYFASSLKDSLEEGVSIDSFLHDRPNGLWLEALLKESNLVEDVIKNKQEFIKVYRLHYADLDSAYFFYNATLKDIPFSWSSKLDSLYNSKLVKVEIIIKKDTSVNATQFNKYRKVSLEVNEPKDFKNKAEVLNFFQEIKKRYSKNNYS